MDQIWQIIMSVSYTHLDVYKRQERFWAVTDSIFPNRSDKTF